MRGRKGDPSPTAAEHVPGPSASLDLYLREIGAHPLLDREQEIELARRIRAGDRQALDQLVAANLRFVVAVAKRYRKRGVALADLVNEGNLGLMRAAEKFDETRGVRFITYAVWWIRQAILRAINEQSRIVRVPSGRVGLASQVQRMARDLGQQFGRRPTPDEIAIELDLPIGVVREAMADDGGYLSLDAPLGGEGESRLLDLVADEAESPAERAQNQALREALEASLTYLDEREAMVLRRYFGLDGADPTTLEEIGRGLGITRERVRQIKDRALARLRAGAPGSVLESFYR